MATDGLVLHFCASFSNGRKFRSMQCPNCDHEGPVSAFGDPLCCPACGAYYEKALATKMRKASSVAPQTSRKKVTLGDIGKRADSVVRAAVDVVTPATTEAHRRGIYGKYYCPACGQVSNGQRYVPGSILIEIILWLCLLIPGVIYSIWRHAAQKKACPKCRSTELIPVDSPKARRELGIE